MRSKILIVAMAFTVIATPSASVAEPTYKVSETAKDTKTVEAVRATISTYALPTKDEVASKEIEEYVKKLEEEKAEAKRKAEEAAKKASAQKRAAPAVSSNATLPDSNACVIAMKKIFPEHLWKIGYAIMKAESGARPNAVGGPNWNGTHDYGCWQINNTTRALDPIQGTKIAWYKYNHSGWYPWTVYKTGAYLRHF